MTHPTHSKLVRKLSALAVCILLAVPGIAVGQFWTDPQTGDTWTTDPQACGSRVAWGGESWVKILRWTDPQTGGVWTTDPRDTGPRIVGWNCSWVEILVKHVIHISVDGLRSDAITTLGRQSVPNFFRLRDEGAFTDNARTDPEIANTLPDHASELTSRPIFGSEGHGWFINSDPGSPFNLHLLKGEYVPSVFDVVHDSGFSTALYANKRKFEVFDRTWSERFGARDQTGVDNGRDKIDTGFIDGDMPTVAREFVTDMGNSDYTYAFLHFRHPDSTGHSFNWDLTPGSDYLNVVVDVDGFLGEILALVQSDPELFNTTALIVTADHAGELGTDVHLVVPEVGLIDSGIIPFYVWGVSIAAGVDLYELNPDTRLDPVRSIPSMSAPVQPIRNGDSGNLALQLLGLPAIPNSTINASQDLDVSLTP